MAKITSRYDADEILFEYDGDLRATVIAAVKAGVNLSGANFSGANLSGANLSGANLSGADLIGTNLSGANLIGTNLFGADLSGANFSSANLSGADLPWANFSRADLSGADLSGANLPWANLIGADLTGAVLNWNSHDLISEILRRSAGNDPEKLGYAESICLRRNMCWDDHLELGEPQLPWALTELAKWIQPDDDHPECLDEYR